jgi:hypothetical protein
MMQRTENWCREIFRTMKQGGLWAIPRSGMVFRKSGKVLLWVANFPAKRKHENRRPREFQMTYEAFGDAGIPVWKTNIIREFPDMDACWKHYALEGETLHLDQDKPWNQDDD